MGAFYSFGITFDDRKNAEDAKAQFINYELKLSDGTNIESRIFIETCNYEIAESQQYCCGIFPIGLELPELNEKLVHAKFFYQIRTQLYKFLINLSLDFNFAWFEFEAADIIKDENPLFKIAKNGVGEILNQGLNGYFEGTYDVSKYIPKRELDGFVMSQAIYNYSNLKIKELKPFKNGYLWLPIQI